MAGDISKAENLEFSEINKEVQDVTDQLTNGRLGAAALKVQSESSESWHSTKKKLD